MTSNTDLERVELEHEIVAGVVSAAGGDALSQLLQIGLQLGVLHLQVLKLWKDMMRRSEQVLGRHGV